MQVEIVIVIKDGKIEVKKVTIKSYRKRGGEKTLPPLSFGLSCKNI